MAAVKFKEAAAGQTNVASPESTSLKVLYINFFLIRIESKQEYYLSCKFQQSKERVMCLAVLLADRLWDCNMAHKNG